MSAQDDLHRPTVAGPTPEPTPVIGAAEATPGHPPGTAPVAEDPHPEKKVGKAFAGGLGAAIVLKMLAKRRQR